MATLYVSVVVPEGAAPADFKLEVRIEGPQPRDFHVPENLATWGHDFIFSYDDQATALTVRVTLAPSVPFFPLPEAKLSVQQDGNLSLQGGAYELRPLGDPKARFHLLAGHCTRLRDVTREMLEKLNTVPPATKLNQIGDRFAAHPIPGGVPIRLPAMECFFAVHAERDSLLWKLAVERRSVEPRMDVRILEVKDGKQKSVPKLVCVAWPDSLDAGVEEVPFLVLIRNRVGLNDFYQGYDQLLDKITPQDAISKGWGFLAYGLYQWLCYQWDPLPGYIEPQLDTKFIGRVRPKGSMVDTRMGFAYQIAAAKKNVVLVIPLNRTGDDGHGDFLSATKAQALLSDIASFMQVQKGRAPEAEVGRTAYCGFSSGHLAIETFVNNSEAEIAKDPAGPGATFYREKLREMYFFDPPASSGAGFARKQVIAASLKWAKDDPEKVIRLYCESRATDDDLVVPAPKDRPTIPFRVSKDSNRSVTLISSAHWIALRKTLTAGSPAVRLLTDQQASIIDHHDGPHPWFSSVCLKDALERSLFKDGG